MKNYEDNYYDIEKFISRLLNKKFENFDEAVKELDIIFNDMQEKQEKINFQSITTAEFCFLFKYSSVDKLVALKNFLYYDSLIYKKFLWNQLRKKERMFHYFKSNFKELEKIDINKLDDKNAQKFSLFLKIMSNVEKYHFEKDLLENENLITKIITYQKNVCSFLEETINNQEAYEKEFNSALNKYHQLIIEGTKIDEEIKHFADNNKHIEEIKKNNDDYSSFSYFNFSIPITKEIFFIDYENKKYIFIDFIDFKTIKIFFNNCFPLNENNIINYDDDYLKEQLQIQDNNTSKSEEYYQHWHDFTDKSKNLIFNA